LRQASAIIHIVDASGSTDLEGNPTEIGRHDPIEDVQFFEYELTMWLFGILKRNWNRLSRRMKAESLKVEKVIAEQLIGAGVTELQVKNAISQTELDKKNTHKWTDEELEKLANIIRSVSKPMILAANKIDIAPKENIKKLMELNYIVVPVSAEAELALRMADKSKAISYIPGDSKFEIISDKLTKAQKKGLEKLQTLLKQYKGTGVQNCINAAALKLLDQIIVYPVEDENKYTDKDGRVLPDAFLMKNGSNAHDLAYLIHSDLGEGFLFAIDARTKKRIGEKKELKDGDVIKIVSTK
ncbi:MAG: YchF-related putative GTPase, partial [Methanosarcinales archaeon]